jgi:hypothetical protein
MPGADGGTLYSQVSRQAHADVTVAFTVVDDALRVNEGAGLGFVPTVLAFWGLTWTHLLSYFGLTSEPFNAWRADMPVAIGRGDLLSP